MASSLPAWWKLIDLESLCDFCREDICLYVYLQMKRFGMVTWYIPRELHLEFPIVRFPGNNLALLQMISWPRTTRSIFVTDYEKPGAQEPGVNSGSKFWQVINDVVILDMPNSIKRSRIVLSGYPGFKFGILGLGRHTAAILSAGWVCFTSHSRTKCLIKMTDTTDLIKRISQKSWVANHALAYQQISLTLVC